MGFKDSILRMLGALFTALGTVFAVLISKLMSCSTKAEPLRMHGRLTTQILNLRSETTSGKVILYSTIVLGLALILSATFYGLTVPMLITFGTFLVIFTLLALQKDARYYNTTPPSGLSLGLFWVNT